MMKITLAKESTIELDLRSDLFWKHESDSFSKAYLLCRHSAFCLGAVMSWDGWDDCDGYWQAESSVITPGVPMLKTEKFYDRRMAETALLGYVRKNVDWTDWLFNNSNWECSSLPILPQDLETARQENFQGRALLTFRQSPVSTVHFADTSWPRGDYSVGSIGFLNSVKEWYVFTKYEAWCRVDGLDEGWLLDDTGEENSESSTYLCLREQRVRLAGRRIHRVSYEEFRRQEQ